MDRLGAWPLRALWVVLPITAGPALGDALDDAGGGVRWVATIGLWAGWALVLLATLVPRSATLTVVRIAVPAAPVAVAWAALVADVEPWLAALGLVTAATAAAVALLATTADAFVDGSSYGDERRMILRTPGALLLGPVELAWVAVVLGATAGPLLLAGERWILGAVVTFVGAPIAVVAARALHGLSRRWVVFVPAGFVLHDLTTLEDPILLPRRLVRRLGPAPVDTQALDLSAGSVGLVLEADLVETVRVLPSARRGAVVPVDAAAVLFAPARPGALLAEAARRRLPVS